MNRLLLLTLLLVACKQKPVEQLPTTDEKEAVVQDTIAVSDIHRTDSLMAFPFWEYKRPLCGGLYHQSGLCHLPRRKYPQDYKT